MDAEKLKEIPTLDLEQELVRRSKNIIFLHITQESPTLETIGWRCKGGYEFCIGLCETLKTYIKENVSKK